MEQFEGEKLSEFEPTTDEDLKQIIAKYGVKASAEDPIPTAVLKLVMNEMIPMYTILFNKSLAERSMEGIKHSFIDPLSEKKDLDVDVKKNYHPVNNLVFLSKSIKPVVNKRLNSHMTKNIHHIKKQFAYKEHHSNETMMAGVANDVLSGFDENKCTVMIFLDLSAAFDTIDIDKMLGILSDEIGLEGIVF